MAYRELVPHPALQPFVDRLWLRTSAGGDEVVRVLPDGCIDLLFDLERETAVAVGAMTAPLLFEPGRRQTLVAVRFRPGGAAPFLGLPVDRITDRRVACEDLDVPGPLGRAPAAREDPLAALQLIERALLQRLPSPAPIQRLVAQAVTALIGPVPPSVARLADRLGCSRQYLGRLFRTQVGLGPKQLARVARVQRAVLRLHAQQDASLALTAAALGFFDEAHMDREFRALVGVRPGVAQDQRNSIVPMRTLYGGP
jgi:AraC-like DNA-binding protein